MKFKDKINQGGPKCVNQEAINNSNEFPIDESPKPKSRNENSPNEVINESSNEAFNNETGKYRIKTASKISPKLSLKFQNCMLT